MQGRDEAAAQNLLCFDIVCRDSQLLNAMALCAARGARPLFVHQRLPHRSPVNVHAPHPECSESRRQLEQR